MTTKLFGALLLLACSLPLVAQEVDISAVKNGILLTLPARQSYKMMASEEKHPQLSLECLHKGKKSVHILLFVSGGELFEANPEAANAKNAEETLLMTINGTKQTTTWVPYGDTQTFAYYGKTEPERLQFLQTLFSSGTVAIEFKPFLTGSRVTAVFDVSKLRDEMNKHTECSTQ